MTAQSASSVALDELNLVIHRNPGPEAITLARQCLSDLESVITRAVAGDADALKEARAAVLKAAAQAHRPVGGSGAPSRRSKTAPTTKTKADADAKATTADADAKATTADAKATAKA